MASKDYQIALNRGDTIGENQLFDCIKNFNIKFIEDSAVMWTQFSNLDILKQESVKQGFRHDFNKIETQLKLSFLKKKIPKNCE